ncbi:MAG: PEP-utilizing enzyme [Actinomycetota bacterium]
MTTFAAPGPGSWELDRSHYDSAVTPVTSMLMTEATEAAYRKLFETVGVPAQTVAMREVNGFVYTRVVPYFGADSSSTRVPPDWLIKLIFRLHPEMRRREQRASEQFDGKTFKTVIEDWHRRIKPHYVERNQAFQATDPAALDDGELADHVDSLVAYVRETYEEHHRLHGYDIGPLALLVVACRDWGIEPGEALAALEGSSPSTVEPRRHLAAIRAEIDAAGAEPTSLDEVRAVSERAAELLDAYLDRHGAVVFSSYDVDGPTLGERPEIVLATILHATEPVEGSASADAAVAGLEARVPAADHAELHDLLADAREAMDMRDDNGPVTVEWPNGLLRLGMVEAGRRLAESGRLLDVEHIFDVRPDELQPLIRSGEGPSAEALADRRVRRLAQRDLDPPERLGPEPVDPPIDAMPPSMARALDMTLAAVAAMGMAERTQDAPLTGAGIGSEGFSGTARVALTAEDALASLEPGEILVTRATSPAFNLVLTLAGGLVTVDGGPMSHAAVLSRELGLPAVIGVTDCLEHVNDGDVIELDPEAGTVRIVSSSG